MAYSADGTRMFSCGTSKEGESYIVEWNESEGAVKRTYHGLGKQSVGVVQFDTTKNRFLAAGDEFVIKFWDMDNVNLLTTTDAEGGLPHLAARKEQSALRAVIKCVEEYKLEAEFPSKNLRKRLDQLEKSKTEKKKPAAVPANKRTRVNSGGPMPPAKAGRSTNA
ncbi:unnamed protein product [Camellia sinensis]